MVPVILAGGAGTRLWPLSRTDWPKQFLPLVNDTTLLQDTCARLEGLSCTQPLFVCAEEQRFILAEQRRAMAVAQGVASADSMAILLEPVARNTAPALALAALQACRNGEDPLLLVLAADHRVADVAAFQAAVNRAVVYAEAGQLVTFGIVPSGPETGYGYIRTGLGSSSQGGGQAFEVAEFVEKPDLLRAQQYLAQNDAVEADACPWLWNSGLFMCKASRYLDLLGRYRPDILRACEEAMRRPTIDRDFIRPDKQAFDCCPSDSIDYAVMEPLCRADESDAGGAVVVPMACGWSDVGSWSALWDMAEKDSGGNVLLGDVISRDNKGSYLRADGKLVAALGLEDVVVVASDDAVLVADKRRVQEVKYLVEQLKAADRVELEQHRKVYRPWGCFDAIDRGDRFQVKRILVKPGGQLSLQRHEHRAEHWVVVRGIARVTRGDDVFLLSENQSAYMPRGIRHRLENSTAEPLEIIEVQTGDYLGEDDIVRLEDHYGRK